MHTTQSFHAHTDNISNTVISMLQSRDSYLHLCDRVCQQNLPFHNVYNAIVLMLFQRNDTVQSIVTFADKLVNKNGRK